MHIAQIQCLSDDEHIHSEIHAVLLETEKYSYFPYVNEDAQDKKYLNLGFYCVICSQLL